MIEIKAFKSLRPTQETVSRIAALPYDVYNRKEAKKEIKKENLSFLIVDKAEATLDDKINIYSNLVYEKARENLMFLINNNFLIKDTQDSLFLYELSNENITKTGIVGCYSVDDYLNSKIKKHELTRVDKELDRIKHIKSLNAQTGPIMLAYKSREDLKKIIEIEKKSKPLYDFSTENVHQRVWKINNTSTINSIQEEFSKMDSLYIADGHHRCESAAKVALEKRASGKENTENTNYNFFLGVAFSQDEMNILDYNRVVKDLNGLSLEVFMSKLEDKFEIELMDSPYKPTQKGFFGMYVDNNWYKIQTKSQVYKPSNNKENIKENLDVSILEKHILKPILNIGDIRTDTRIDFVGGIRGLEELEKRCNSDMKIAFSLYPTSIDDLMKIADQDELMPPKSTWFEPKLRSGIFIHEI